MRNTGLPVRSAVLKPHADELVVASVTSSESSLLIVFCLFQRIDDELDQEMVLMDFL